MSRSNESAHFWTCQYPRMMQAKAINRLMMNSRGYSFRSCIVCNHQPDIWSARQQQCRISSSFVYLNNRSWLSGKTACSQTQCGCSNTAARCKHQTRLQFKCGCVMRADGCHSRTRPVPKSAGRQGMT